MLTQFTCEQAMDLSEVTEFEWSSPIPINFPPFEQALTRGLQNLEVREPNLLVILIIFQTQTRT